MSRWLIIIWFCVIPTHAEPSGLIPTPAGINVSSDSTTLSDAQIREILIGGYWIASTNSDDPPLPMVQTYRIDGTTVLYFYETEECKDLLFEIDGTWKVHDGIVTETVTKSTGPAFLSKQFPVGKVDKDQVIRFESNRLTEKSLDDGAITAMEKTDHACIRLRDAI